MLDKHISPDDYDECPECGGILQEEGDKWEGSIYCEDCSWRWSWDNLPN